MSFDPFPSERIPFYKDRRVVVTGATGLIGSYVVKLLHDCGARWVRAVAHSRAPNLYSGMANEILVADLMIPAEAAAAVKGADIVLSCAGITGGIGLTQVDPVSYAGPATCLVINTLHAAHENGVEHFGFLSSTTVYAARESPVDEMDELIAEPFPLYSGIGWSKRFLEKLCKYYVDKTKVKIAIVRPSGAYGRFDNFDEGTSHVIPGMLHRALSLKPGEPFEVWGDGTDVRDFVHAQDVAMGLLLAVSRSTKAGAFNIASGIGVTTRDLAVAVLKATGTNAEIVVNPKKLVALKKRTVSIEKARNVLDYRPMIRLHDGLKDTAAWMQSMGGR